MTPVERPIARRFAGAAAWLWRRGPGVVLVCACLVVALMYCTNDDMGGDPRSPRGDGVYRPVLARGDGHMLYLMTRSLVFDRDLVFDNDLRRFGDPWQAPNTKTGRKNIPHPIGPALIWAPLLAAAQGGAVVANAVGADIETHGYTTWHQRIVFASSAVFACLAVLLGVLVFRRRVGGRWAPAWAGVAVLLGTSLTYYATYMPSYGHAMDAGTAGGSSRRGRSPSASCAGGGGSCSARCSDWPRWCAPRSCRSASWSRSRWWRWAGAPPRARRRGAGARTSCCAAPPRSR